MNTWVLIGIIAIVAYIIQIFFGLRQIKHFNHVYQKLRQQGRVAIGRRPGRIKSGTLIMFSLNQDGIIMETQKMQGVSVISKFKRIDKFNGIEIKALTSYHPLVSKEIKITRQTIENARELYLRVQSGDYQESSPLSLVDKLKIHAMVVKNQLLHK